MTRYESEIQELVYDLLSADETLAACLGADETDGRICLSFNESEIKRISASRQGYIVIESMPAPAPVHLGDGIDDRTERYCLHVVSAPERREVRAAVADRLRELLHRKTFATARFIVYHVSEEGRETTLTDSGLVDYRYSVSFQFLPKGS